MSARAEDYVRPILPTLTQRQGQVLHLLAALADDQGHSVVISKSHLAQLAGLSLATVRAVLHALQEKGYVRRERQAHDDYGFVANCYSFVGLATTQPAEAPYDSRMVSQLHKRKIS